MIAGLKRLTRMVFGRASSYRIFSWLGSRVDYAAAVGDISNSSLVAAVLNWVAKTFPEAPPALWREDEDGTEERVRDHPMLRVLRRPNPHYTGVSLWTATVVDWMVDGNAYWWKQRDRAGTVQQIWWIPHWIIEPKGDETTFVTHYEYRPGTEPFSIAPDEIVHFRFGMDPDNPRVGRSQLKSVLREVYTDEQAAAFTAALLANQGVPGIVISPEKGVTVSQDDADAMKDYVQQKLTGDKRGEPLVMTGATKVEQFGFSPEQLTMTALRRIPEERVSAVTGIPAIVVGFGAGLERSTFTNMGEAREAAYEAGLIPTQRILAEEILFQLLTEFEEDPFGWRFGFDLSKVRVLQEDLYRQAQRHALGVNAGAEMVSEWRRAMDLPVDESRDNVFLRPANIVTVPAGDAGAQVPLPSQNGNGNGGAHHGTAEIVAAVEAMIERRELTATT